MIVGGAILPHPPVILPDYAARRGPEVQRTIDAVREASRFVAEELRPDRIVISSPHKEHGFEVPLHFIREAMGGRLPGVERILTDVDELAHYKRLGEELRWRESARPDRTAVIASGDLSHRLTDDGPYGFHALGPALDAQILECVRSGSPDCLLDIDREVIEQGAECGLRSFIFGLAAFASHSLRVLSYEGPFGVGYLVAVPPARIGVPA